MNDLSNLEITILLNQIAQGDDKAMTVLYKHYQRSLFAFVRLQVSDNSLAEEIVQETFLAVSHKPAGFNGTSKFSTWLCAIAKRKAIDHWRKINSQPVMREMDEEINEIPDDNGNVLHFLLQNERDEILMACIDRLSVAHKEVIHLAYVEGASMNEIAKIISGPVGTVKSRIHHATLNITNCVSRTFGRD